MGYLEYDLTLTEEEKELRDAVSFTVADGENALLSQAGASRL